MKPTAHRQRKYVCSYEGCGKAYSRPSLLEQHRRTHANERPFQCDLCGKKFFRTSHLKSHKWTHSDEKPLKCSFCPKGFVTGQQLSRHVNTHHASEVKQKKEGNKTITHALTPPEPRQSAQLQNRLVSSVSMTPVYPMSMTQVPTPLHYYQESSIPQVSSYNIPLQPPSSQTPATSAPVSSHQLFSQQGPPNYKVTPLYQHQVQVPVQIPLQQQQALLQLQQQVQLTEMTPLSQGTSQFSPHTPQAPHFSPPQGPPTHFGPLQQPNPYLRYESGSSSTSSHPFLTMCPYECGLSFPEGKELNDHMSEHQIMELDISRYATRMGNQGFTSYEWASNPFCRVYSEYQPVIGT